MPDPQKTANSSLLRCAKLAAKDARTHSTLTDISLELQTGELLGVIGNRPGEISLLLEILAGLYMPHAGTVLLDEKPLALHGFQITQSIHYQGPSWTPPGVMTPLELLLFTGKRQNLTGKTMRSSAQDMLDHLGLSSIARQPLHALTEAHRQLACFGAAMMGLPRLIILDRFDRDLSLLQQDIVWQIIDQKMHNDHTAFIIAPSNIQRLDNVTYVAIVKDGALFAYDTPQHIMQRFHAQPRVELQLIDPASAYAKMQKKLQHYGDVQVAGSRMTIVLAEEYAAAGIPANITISPKASRRQTAAATSSASKSDDSWLLDEQKVPGTIGLTVDTILQTVGRDLVKTIWIIPPTIEQAYRNAMQGA